MTALIDTYRNRALDVFVRGLTGDISRMLIIQKPTNLPEAYSSCLEIQNLNFRSIPIHNRNFNNTIAVPVNQINSDRIQQYTSKPIPLPRISLQQRNLGYGMQYQQQPYQQQSYQQQAYQHQPYQQQHYQQPYQQQQLQQYPPQQNYFGTPPARPIHPKPPIPMSIDESGNTKRINYMNRPSNLNLNPRRARSPDTHLNQRKQQRLFHIEQQEGEQEYEECIDNYSDLEDKGEEEEENIEVNFITSASQAYLT